MQERRERWINRTSASHSDASAVTEGNAEKPAFEAVEEGKVESEKVESAV